MECVWVDVLSVEQETDAALLIRTDDGDEAWIPKSQIHEDSEVLQFRDYGWMGIPKWLAEDKGLPYEEEISIV